MIRRKELAGMIFAAGLTFALLSPCSIWAEEAVAGNAASSAAIQVGTSSPSDGEASDSSGNSSDLQTETAAPAATDSVLTDSVPADSGSSADSDSKDDASAANTCTLKIEYVNEQGAALLDPTAEEYQEGSDYEVLPAYIPGYEPQDSVIFGTISSDTTVTFVYTENEQHTLTIRYLYEDGTQAAESYTAQLRKGESYQEASPAIAGYTPDTANVSGTMDAEDISADVTYRLNSYLLTVNYIGTDGAAVSAPATQIVRQGDAYSIPSPALEGMTADQTAVSGIMGAQDTSFNVTYSVNQYSLTILYEDEDGNVLDSYDGTYSYGEEYSVSSPDISGYDADESEVSGFITGETTRTVLYYSNKTAAQSSTNSTDSNKNQTNYSNYRIPTFTRVDKVYAVAHGNVYVNVREGKSTTSRIIGTLETDGLCYVLADSDSDWVYIESGDVRGFISRKCLLLGNEAAAFVERNGESNLKTAQELIAGSQNAAYRYTLTTTKDPSSMSTALRQLIISYAEQFLGNPYVWGGTSLTNGCDCSGYVQQIYAAFGITLPRCSYEQAEAGTKIAVRDAVPGDLIFYAQNGVVYHVLMYIGDGKAVNAASSSTGIVISNVNYSKACWACNFLSDIVCSSTQASNWAEIGRQATAGDTSAQTQIINVLAQAANKEWYEYGFCRSVLIAQVIQESGWLSFSGASIGGIQPADNNILGMNADLLNDTWVSNWNGTAVSRNVPQSVNGVDVYGYEQMRTYSDIESCMEDYAAYKTGVHPDMKGVTDTDKVIQTALKGYASDPTYNDSIKEIIRKYNLTRFDTQGFYTSYATDTTGYTADEMNEIYAIVAQEDDTSYEGALAVISCVMNRADLNYGGYGTTALAQLTASGQFCYSPSISDPSYWKSRLDGNVADFVKQAVSDCLTQGIRNHGYLNFRSTNRTGNYIQVGSNWYF